MCLSVPASTRGITPDGYVVGPRLAERANLHAAMTSALGAVYCVLPTLSGSPRVQTVAASVPGVQDSSVHFFAQSASFLLLS
jgi:hypothetical protein